MNSDHKLCLSWLILLIVTFSELLLNAEEGQGAVIRVPGDQPTIQAGIDAAVAGDTVLVATGTYKGTGNRNVTFHGKSITVMGSGSGCLIDCERGGRGFIFQDGEGPTTRVTGFTIRNGGFPPGQMGDGGAIYCENASPTISNLTLLDNETGWGVFYLGIRGGGIYLSNSSAMIAHCRITQNRAGFGGGIYASGDGQPLIVNCIITDNTAGQEGGGFCVTNGQVVVVNCTVIRNRARKSGGALYLDASATIVLNSIFWHNGSDEVNAGGAGLDISFSLVSGGHQGVGNFDGDPFFVNGANGPFYLSQVSSGQAVTSPCVDAGSVDAAVLCYQIVAGTICLNSLTTRTDRAADAGFVDVGYHYDRPPLMPRGVWIDMPLVVNPFSDFWVTGFACNDLDALASVPVAFILEFYGGFWSWPSWSYYHPVSGGQIDYQRLDVPQGGVTIQVIPPMTWPDTGDDRVTDLRFYGALLTQDLTSVIGEMAIATWRYGP